MWSGKKFINNKQKIFDCFWKKKKIIFYKLKKLKKEKKNYFREIGAKRSAPKWTIRKMGNAK